MIQAAVAPLFAMLLVAFIPKVECIKEWTIETAVYAKLGVKNPAPKPVSTFKLRILDESAHNINYGPKFTKCYDVYVGEPNIDFEILDAARIEDVNKFFDGVVVSSPTKKESESMPSHTPSEKAKNAPSKRKKK